MAEQKFDFKKEFKNIYLQKTQPVIVEVPPMTYLCVDGKGNPNTTQEYKDALAILYGLSYTIKMSKMDGTQPVGYFDYVVPPLEGLWWMENGEGFDGIHITDKTRFCWTSLPLSMKGSWNRPKKSCIKRIRSWIFPVPIWK